MSSCGSSTIRTKRSAGSPRWWSGEERVVECASVTGGSDYILMIAALDPEDLETFLSRGILASGLVRSSETHFVLRRTKTRSPWPLLPGEE